MLVPIALKRIVDDLGLEPSLRIVPIALLLAYGPRGSASALHELRQVLSRT